MDSKVISVAGAAHGGALAWGRSGHQVTSRHRRRYNDSVCCNPTGRRAAVRKRQADSQWGSIYREPLRWEKERFCLLRHRLPNVQVELNWNTVWCWIGTITCRHFSHLAFQCFKRIRLHYLFQFLCRIIDRNTSIVQTLGGDMSSFSMMKRLSSFFAQTTLESLEGSRSSGSFWGKQVDFKQLGLFLWCKKCFTSHPSGSCSFMSLRAQ